MISSAFPALPHATSRLVSPAGVSASGVDFSIKEFPLLDRVKILPPATRDEIIQKQLCTRKTAGSDSESSTDNPVESEPEHLSETDWDSVQRSLKFTGAFCRVRAAKAQEKAEKAAKDELQYVCHGLIKIAAEASAHPSIKKCIECEKRSIQEYTKPDMKEAEQKHCAARKQFLIDLWEKHWSEEYFNKEVFSQSEQIMDWEKARRTNQFIQSREAQDNQTNPIENTDNDEPFDVAQFHRRAWELRAERVKADQEMHCALIRLTDLQYTEQFFALGKSLYGGNTEPSGRPAECR